MKQNNHNNEFNALLNRKDPQNPLWRAWSPTIQPLADEQGCLLTAGVRIQDQEKQMDVWQRTTTLTSNMLSPIEEEETVDIQQAIRLTERLIKSGVDPDKAVDVMIALLKGDQ